MKGISLSILRDDLIKVAKQHEDNPAAAIVGIDEKIAFLKEYLEDRYDEFEFLKHFHRLMLPMFKNFSFDELCKLKYSTTTSMHESIDRLFEDDPRYEVVRKIKSSMWRWGMKMGAWSEVVDAYDHIRRFTFVDNSDFMLRLDHSTYNNEYGWSKYARVFIDGAFAFLVYYKGEHVMTLGFSIMAGRRVLIQQVQLHKRTGNRFLFKLPANRMEHVVSLFRQHFPGYALCIIGGEALVEKTIANYRGGLERAQKNATHYRALSDKSTDDKAAYERDVARCKEEVAYFKNAIAHLEDDKPRLAQFYSDAGKYTLGRKPSVVVNRLPHFKVAA